MDKGREFVQELTLEEPSQLLLEKWLEPVDEFTEKIEEVAVDVKEMGLLITAPGIASYSGFR